MTNVLLTPLTSGATTPNQSALASGTTTIDLRARVSRANWADTSNLGAFIANWSSTVANCRWLFKSGPSGVLVVQWYNSSAALQTATSTVAVGLGAGAIKWVRALITPSAGTVAFYTSDDDVTYTQLGTTVTGFSTAALQTPTTAQVISVGEDASAANGMFQHVYRTKIVINGTQLLNMDWTAQAATNVTGTWTSATGEVWTRAGTATLSQEDTATTTFVVTSAPIDKIADVGSITIAINRATQPWPSSPPFDSTLYRSPIALGNVRALRMLNALAPYFQADPFVQSYISAMALELDRIEAAAEALRSGAFPSTADERTLAYYEFLFQISPDGLTDAQRRANVVSYLHQRSVATRYGWQQAVQNFIGSTSWSYSEAGPNTFQILLNTPFDPVGDLTAQITAFAQQILPAHLLLVVNGSYGNFKVGISRVGIDPL